MNFLTIKPLCQRPCPFNIMDRHCFSRKSKSHHFLWSFESVANKCNIPRLFHRTNKCFFFLLHRASYRHFRIYFFLRNLRPLNCKSFWNKAMQTPTYFFTKGWFGKHLEHLIAFGTWKNSLLWILKPLTIENQGASSD